MKTNIYFLLKLKRKIKNIHIKNLGIYLLHIFKKRYLGVFLDPVLACNLRCRMCYFSDDDKRKQLKGIFNQDDIVKIANAFFHRALKVQIGCGAEPSLFQHNKKIIELAKEKRVPYISMTTNGLLFTEQNWIDFAEAGLDEVTISVHGTNKTSYEYFMTNASFEIFCKAMETLTSIKNQFPNLKIRLNYTVNKDNLEELTEFFTVFGNYKFDILQIRPIQQIGNSAYANFSWTEIYEKYDEIIKKVKESCIERGITCIAPNKEDLIKEENVDSAVFESTYCYISPRSIWKDDFDLQKDNYEIYAKRTHLAMKLFKNIFHSKKYFQTSSGKLNYEIY
jgi:MoaA/NifB/PqqE/SkfB family radical SAM enzyme